MSGEHTPGRRDTVSPPASFVEQANVSPSNSVVDAESHAVWERAAELLTWETPPDQPLPDDDTVEWYADGTLNAAANCLDRHLETRKNRVAIRWEGADGDTRLYTYLDLHREVNEAAAALRELGVETGDVVTCYLPVIPELVVTMLACARIGALHNVVFAGFSADELATRLDRTESGYLVTCDGYYRRGSAVNQLTTADTARMSVDHDVEPVVVGRLDDDAVYLGEEHRRYETLLDAHRNETVEPVSRAATDPLFVIYTSGTTGEPSRVTHTTGGYLAHVAWTGHSVLDIKPDDTHWCAADVAWITGHSYMVYAPLALGATTLLYEGAPDQPEKDRMWQLVERHRVDTFYTASTAVRAFMKWGETHPESHNLSSLRLLGMVGEPIDPRTWNWHRNHVGGGDTPVVDTWWQTETGGILVSTLPGVDDMKPGSAGPALPGVDIAVIDEEGEPVAPGESGYLAVTSPWPGMSQSLAAEASGANADDWYYVTSDRAVIDEDGYVTFLGREDDTVTVGNTAFGPATLESAIIDVNGVAEAAVVEANERGGTALAYVCTKHGKSGDEQLRDRIEHHVSERLGPTARFGAIVFIPELPKTHSGKIMRRLLGAIADGDSYGDTSALRNPETVGEIETVTRDE
ncbi:acetate--CoA ligase [Halosegnis rubeus]|jgi:acetyl-CoA synthetase|uniref:acetate--CoA ligase n=1 Tax=Halosegnis rubeus TaxID=2212850 RepID=A0A5N5UQZ0_9EURY|nr:acetate--CoA ligase [Halosegnis rubeus]KAB7515819.1 acetate--CoA ligase [Halosegnis rubeus]KAB7516966.1 acetate--CoA ligase [Halosegnis rubeus]KAB7519905.1 acetate--CoA ligase [Halosegnis rubeus]